MALTMELGTVISTADSPTTRNFSFVVADRSVRRGQFVQLEAEDGTLIALIQDLTRSNRYFERAESVNEYEKGGKSFASEFPTAEWEYVVANCIILGAFDGALARAGFPPSPGAKVSAIDLSKLKSFLRFDDSGLDIGKLLRHDLAVKIDFNRLLQKHLSILGISGSGKSVCTSVLIEELLARPVEDGRLGIIVFDVHGEYSCFADRQVNPDYAGKAVVVKGEDVRVETGSLSASSFQKYAPDISGVAVRELDKIISAKRGEVRSGGAAYSLDDLVQAAESSGLKTNVKDALVAWLYDLSRLRAGTVPLFGRVGYPKTKNIVAPGQLTVFDLSGVTNEKVKQIIVEHYSRALFNSRQRNEIAPFLLVVEEAHNFAPEKASREHALAKGIINKIAREGRKFGASLCLVSQRPKQLSTTALSQCNSSIIFRITNPYDVDHIAQSNESIDADVQGQLTTLSVGECIVVGEATGQPVFVRVRNRKSRKTPGKGDDLALLARRFESAGGRKLNDGDAEAFL